MNPYPAVLVDGPWVKPADQFSHIQDETVRRLELEIKRNEESLARRMAALAEKVDEVEEGCW
jgi:hypothetical protein